MKAAWTSPLLLSIFILTACTTGPDPKRPEPFYTPDWVEADEDARSMDDHVSDWWKSFEDPVLEDLLDRAMEHNRSLQAAAARIRRAFALRGETRADLLPQLDADGSVQRQRNAGSSPASPSSGSFTLWDAGLSASWELDIFGRTRRELEAEDAQIQRLIEERRGMMIAVRGETARNYFQLRGLQKNIQITHENLDLQTRTLTLVERLFELGEASEFDLTRARGQLQLTRARLPDLHSELRGTLHRLSVLIGELPGGLESLLDEPGELPAPPELLPLGQSSDLLRRRPDIRAAERELLSAQADVGVAMAEYFPRFTLLGSAGRSASRFSELSDSGSNRYRFGPQLDWPLIQGGGLRARVDANREGVEEALALYEQTVIEAFADTETALVSYLQERERSRTLSEALASRQRAVELARSLYNSGEEDFLSVLDAERELLSVQDDWVRSETLTSLRLVTLYTALGGGWAPEPDEETP